MTALGARSPSSIEHQVGTSGCPRQQSVFPHVLAGSGVPGPALQKTWYRDCFSSLIRGVLRTLAVVLHRRSMYSANE